MLGWILKILLLVRLDLKMFKTTSLGSELVIICEVIVKYKMINKKMYCQRRGVSLIYSFILSNKQIQSLTNNFYMPGNVLNSVGCFVVQRRIGYM